MKKLIFSAFAALFYSTSAFADASSAGLAKTYVQHAIDAMGGIDLLKSVKTLRIEYRGHSYMLDESERSDGPWIVTYENDIELRDYEHSALQREKEHSSLGSPEVDKSTVTVADGVAQSSSGGHKAPSPLFSDDSEEAFESLTFAPERIVLLALGAADLTAQPDSVLHGEPYHVVSFSHAHLPVRLYFNAYSALPGVVEWTSSYPNSMFWRVWGDVQNRCEFTVYSLLPGGLRLPFQRDHSRNGQPFHSLTISKAVVNPQIPADAFEISREAAAAFRKRRADMPDGPPLGKPASLVDGDDSLVQFVGTFNCAIIKQADGLMLIEAPTSAQHTKTFLVEAGNRYPGSQIKALITTSDAWAHFGGLREIAARGIPIYATDLNKPLLERLVRAPFTQHPDSLEKSTMRPEFHWVSEKTALGSGPNRLEVFPIRNASGERMLMVYFPERKLLYTSDLIQPLGDGTFFWPDYARELVDAVNRENLSVERFFGMHAKVTPYSALTEFLAKSLALSGAPD